MRHLFSGNESALKGVVLLRSKATSVATLGLVQMPIFDSYRPRVCKNASSKLKFARLCEI